MLLERIRRVDDMLSAQGIRPDMSKPNRLAFITGCGRSGTTILGEVLSHHEDIQYLNDRFDLWVETFPVADIWGKRHEEPVPGAKIALTREDCQFAEGAGGRRDLLRKLKAERNGKPLLIEKLAINNFRLDFLQHLFPDAYFLNIIRHGVEVAFSIQERILAKVWYGEDDRKWSYLAEYARTAGYGNLLPLCETGYEKGLLEWRMSIEAAESILQKQLPKQFLQVRYEDLISDPLALCQRLEDFLEIEPSEAMRQFAVRKVRRRSLPASERKVPARTEVIAGSTLFKLGYSFSSSDAFLPSH